MSYVVTTRISLLAAVVGLFGTAGVSAHPLTTATISVPMSPRVALRDLGRAPASYPVSIVITLPYRHAAQLERLVEAQADPDSPSYHRFLTPAQFAVTFGPTAQDEADVMGILHRAGFTITQRFANRTVLDARAPAAVAERYFNTEIHLALQAGSVRYLNVKAAKVPRELSARTLTITGLSDVWTVPPVQRSEYRSGADASGVGRPLENEGGFGPLAWARAYDLPVQHGYDGKNVRIAELESAEPIPNGFIQTYAWAFRLPMPTGATGAQTKLEQVDGGCAPGCEAGSFASDYLDYDEYQEFLAALAPGVDAYLYQIPDDSTTSFEDGLNKIVTDNRVDIVALGNIPYYEDTPNDEAFAIALDHVMQEGNALGVTFIVQSLGNDTGSFFAPSTPADSPHALAVGVSNLQVDSDGNYHSEASCIEPPGGISTTSSFFPQPSYQAGISGASKNARELPDLVSANWAELSTAKTIPLWGYAGWFPVYVGINAWENNEGEPNPSPLVATIAAIDQMNGSRSGLINTAIYKLYEKRRYAPTKAPAFRDITVATPGGASGASAIFPVGPGFDKATGIGSVDGWNLANALKKKKS